MTTTPEPALSYASVHKRFGDAVALNDVSFEVRRGEVFGLLGPNGAGKTTLIRLALDILRPDDGDVRLLGAPVIDADHDRVAYLPEERGLYRHRKVLAVLVYLARLKGVPRRDAKDRARFWLDKVGLAHTADRKVEQLSKGMSQKIQIAAALIADPEFAILDEPFSGLDPIHVEHVLELIRERRDAGLTTILSTHLMDRVEAVCDRMVLMSRGEVVLHGTLDAIRADHSQPEVTVEFRGAEPSGVDAIEEVEAIEEVARNPDGSTRLVLRADAEPAVVLRALIEAGADLSRFEPMRPSIERIFVSTVRAREAS